ncbi:Crp/Fnr family transcriptional regulator [bacterium]|nr:Crp/Fnr family transcriptional regulator [bacterium]
MINILKQIDFFKNFDDKQLLGFSKIGTREIIDTNQFILKNGNVSRGLIVILRGVFSTTVQGVEKQFKQGDFFSPLSLLHKTKQKLSVKASQKGEIFIFTKENFDILSEKSPKFALMLTSAISKSFLISTEKYIDINEED